MAVQKTLIDSYPTHEQAWAQCQCLANRLRRMRLARRYGVKVEKVCGSYAVILIDRKPM